MNNRRRYERVPIDTNVRVYYPNSGFMQTEARDISAEGIGVAPTEHTASGQAFEIFLGKVVGISIDLSSLEGGGILEAQCVVNSVPHADSGNRIGLRFLRLTEADRQRLQGVIRRCKQEAQSAVDG